MDATMPIQPSGLKPPQPLKTDGNLATNCKPFKRTWDNYSIVARLGRFDEKFKTAMFLSVIGEDAMEIFHGMDFTAETHRQVLSKVIEKFEEFCIGETNETYERFIFNRRSQEENESIDQYVTVLRKLAQKLFLQLSTSFAYQGSAALRNKGRVDSRKTRIWRSKASPSCARSNRSVYTTGTY